MDRLLLSKEACKLAARPRFRGNPDAAATAGHEIVTAVTILQPEGSVYLPGHWLATAGSIPLSP